MAEDTGPLAYENWKAALANLPPNGAQEFPLFSDARIVGELVEGYGPYQLFNTILLENLLERGPSVVLRITNHLKHDHHRDQMLKTDIDRYHGGSLCDEIAALVSLCFGIRLKAGGYNRTFEPEGDPRGRPIALGLSERLNPVLLKHSGYNPTLPRVLGEHALSDSTVLYKFPDMSPQDAMAVVRSARLYQDAIWISESEPELSWIFMVSSIETAASHWRREKESSLERLKADFPDLENILKQSGGDELVENVAKIISNYLGATRKFLDFILHFLPEPRKDRPSEFAMVSWAREDMEKSLKTIYRWRSRALHGGLPFPHPMCIGPSRDNSGYWERPAFLAMEAKGGVWVQKDTPMFLHTFEYIVRNVLIKWWESMLLAGRQTT